jgi:hypothetical protein
MRQTRARQGRSAQDKRKLHFMGLILVVLLLALLLGGLGFMAHVLWIAAVVVLALWLVGFVATGGGDGRRWYRW